MYLLTNQGEEMVLSEFHVKGLYEGNALIIKKL